MKKIFLFLTIVLVFLIVLFYKYEYMNETIDTSEPILKKVVYRKQITCKILIDKFNEILLKNNLKEINLDYLSVIDNTYYVGLYQDVILFITPHNYYELSSDLVYQCGIIFDGDTNNYELAKLYYSYLIVANNEFIFDSFELTESVINGNLIERNNGLILAAIENEGEINLFIERKYNT